MLFKVCCGRELPSCCPFKWTLRKNGKQQGAGLHVGVRISHSYRIRNSDISLLIGVRKSEGMLIDSDY